MQFLTIIKLIRVEDYVKNTFIFLPLFFSLTITNTRLLVNAMIAFIAFSLIASAVYIFNDYQDITEDRRHPKKKNRPLAAGDISKTKAIIVMLTLLIIGFGLMTLLSIEAGIILGFYVLINIAYSLVLKNVAILDVVIIAIGFVLRLFVGSFATNVELSSWIVIMTFLLALFLALAKRRDDVLVFLKTGEKLREVVGGYNLQLLDIAMAIMASVVIVAYIIYTTSLMATDSKYLYITALFVILGVMRYLQIIFVRLNSGSPTKIVLKDKFMQLSILAWCTSFYWMLY